MTFKDLKLAEDIVKGIEDKGYETPTDIQTQAIPLLLAGHDVLAQSQTGTGKTAAFGLPILSQLSAGDKKYTQALILCPTRELSMQVSDELKSFAKYRKDLRIISVYGGSPIDKQIRELKRGADIVVATPGRLMDHLRRKTIRLNECHHIVLDEADEMLNMGFIEDIETIFEYLPEERQMAFFSATIPTAIRKLSDEFLKDPQHIKLSNNNLTVSRIEQIYYSVSPRFKNTLVVQLLQLHNTKSTMIFCNTKKMVDELTTYLNKAGYPALGLHGDMKQEMRSMVMDRFKKGKVSILIATDVAARGIDVDSMDMVLNYDIPQELEYYVHRIGRTGRAGKEGLAITLVTPRQKGMIRQIERLSNSKIVEQPLPTKEQLNDLMVQQIAQQIRYWSSVEPNKLFDIAYNGLRQEQFTQEDIIVAFINKLIHENDLEAIQDAGSDRKGNRRNQGPMTTFKISLGKQDGVAASHIVSAVAHAADIKGSEIGKIQIAPKHATVEVPEALAEKVFNALKTTKIKNKKFKVEPVTSMERNKKRRRR